MLALEVNVDRLLVHMIDVVSIRNLLPVWLNFTQRLEVVDVWLAHVLLFLSQSGVFSRVEVRTFKALEALLLRAFLDLEDHRVKQRLFPAVGELAVLLVGTSIVVLLQELVVLPVWTLLRGVVEDIWSSSEVLEVMSVEALSLVVVKVERTPFCFEECDVEVKVLV